jgi:hypothetical protein
VHWSSWTLFAFAFYLDIGLVLIFSEFRLAFTSNHRYDNHFSEGLSAWRAGEWWGFYSAEIHILLFRRIASRVARINPLFKYQGSLGWSWAGLNITKCSFS